MVRVIYKCENKHDVGGRKKNAVHNFGVAYVILLIVGCRYSK